MIYDELDQSHVTLAERIPLIEQWFIASGIQSEEGGVYAWHDNAQDQFAYLYSEITGYTITFFCFLYELRRDEAWLRRAETAAQWILDHAMHPSGGVLTRLYRQREVAHYSFARENIYSFDCAMVAFGMLTLYKKTSKSEYLECAQGIVDFLLKELKTETGLFAYAYDAKNATLLAEHNRWSKQGGSFLSKLSLALCELAAIVGDERYRQAAEKLIEQSVAAYLCGQRFVTNQQDQSSHLHPLCYTLEGIAFYTYRTGDGRFIAAAREALSWVGRLQESNGGFATRLAADGSVQTPHQRSDIQAQLLRAHFLLSSQGSVAPFNAETLLFRLLQFQNIGSEAMGGFVFGQDEDGVYKDHSNAWCSMFAHQALVLYREQVDRETALNYLV